MSMMLRWRIWLTARASATNRDTISGSAEYCRLRTLIATSLPISGWEPRKTVPKPPAPIFSSTTYSPTFCPGSRSRSWAPAASTPVLGPSLSMRVFLRAPHDLPAAHGTRQGCGSRTPAGGGRFDRCGTAHDPRQRVRDTGPGRPRHALRSTRRRVRGPRTEAMARSDRRRRSPVEDPARRGRARVAVPTGIHAPARSRSGNGDEAPQGLVVGGRWWRVVALPSPTGLRPRSRSGSRLRPGPAPARRRPGPPPRPGSRRPPSGACRRPGRCRPGSAGP